ncbi:MAG: potassium transporter TrkG [Candidatus Poribacteria bacterium]|jgi:trk system potassium uptake protein TrkH|nr:potassium transporter TrkG [Candidatus Poribacteria bacterium]MDP6746526.1 potassium transporter TrkG [Candidatus Poribacteria bacterium]MDP6997011.1 potassium transporter TrkG [Candidatus Poribacteria bacterium]
MNLKPVLFTLSILLLAISVALFIPLAVAAAYAEQDLMAFTKTIVITAIIGGILYLATRDVKRELGNREGFAVVTFGWLFVALAGSLPYFFYQDFLGNGIDQQVSVFRRFTDSYFESMSGFTTTGATILEDIEHLPHGILFWRSFTHWFGGMGILVLAVAILPLLGVGGMQLYQAEAPGPQSDRITPRIQETAKVLWWVYVLITLAEVVFLWIGIVWIVPENVRETPSEGLYYAFCHAFGTMATGGFSPKNASIGYYNSVYIDVVVIIFMFIAGTNFSLHYKALKGDFGGYLKDEEFRFYLFLITLAMAALTLNTMLQPVAVINSVTREVDQDQIVQIENETYPVVDGKISYQNQSYFVQNQQIVVNGTAYEVYQAKVVYKSIGDALRFVGFQVLSIITTTGYGTADFEMWPFVSQVTLVFLMCFGGCAGSTGGGMKQVRFLLLIKQSYLEIKHLIIPHAVLPVKLNGRIVPRGVMTNILGFFFIGVAIFVTGTVILTGLGLDLLSASTAVVSALMNIGPALGSLGPTNNYAHIVPVGKWVLSLCMLLGRLELYTVLIILTPLLWRK